ncbi:Predicted arabinose efflux permease, MFS family [Sphingobacterium wenxiniae]|uniref:Predicted arabinose efflux permease, MFS family n=2 Tax=Sphingobacterium wenxiniae TaxID=683125 RepID=A0A1I6PB74_9SPHI|nr:Predicted arabinose efflux permease, MFS family [Sphingobacterium wenxiniae]
MVLSPLGNILMSTMNLSTQEFGSVVSAYAISACLSGFLAAGFADKYDRKKLLLFFYTGFVIGTLFCALADTYVTLLAARIFTGIFGGVIGSISMAIVTDLFVLEQRGKVMGLIQMSFAASQILGIPLGLWMATHWGWHSTFFALVILSLFIGIAVVFKLKPVTEHLKFRNNKSPILHLWHTIKRKDYRTGFVAIMLLSMGGFMIAPFSSDFYVNNVKINIEDVPIIFMWSGIASVFIMPLIGRLSDRFDKLNLFVIGTVIACVMVIISTNLGPTPLWKVVIINILMFVGIMSRMVPSQALNSAVPEAEDRGAYMSVNSSLQQLAGGLGAIFAGFIVVKADATSPLKHFDTLGYVMVVIMLLCVFLMWRVNKMINAKK